MIATSFIARCISLSAVCRYLQDSHMRAGFHLHQPARAATATASSFGVLKFVVPVKARMSATATAAEPAVAGSNAPEPQTEPTTGVTEPPVASAAAAPEAVAAKPEPSLPDAASDPVVAGVLKRFIQQYETKDTVQQVGPYSRLLEPLHLHGLRCQENSPSDSSMNLPSSVLRLSTYRLMDSSCHSMNRLISTGGCLTWLCRALPRLLLSMLAHMTHHFAVRGPLHPASHHAPSFPCRWPVSAF